MENLRDNTENAPMTAPTTTAATTTRDAADACDHCAAVLAHSEDEAGVAEVEAQFFDSDGKPDGGVQWICRECFEASAEGGYGATGWVLATSQRCCDLIAEYQASRPGRAKAARRNGASVITDYETEFQIEYEDYYQGFGTSHTRFSYAQTGIGASAVEALDDALEQVATGGNVSPASLDKVVVEVKKEVGAKKFNKVHKLGDGEWVHCGIRYNLD